MARKSGATGFVQFNSVPLKFDEWGFGVSGDLPDMSALGDLGEYRVKGFPANQIDLSGPYDVGAMALVWGEEYTVTVGIAPGIFIQAVCRIADINVNNKLKDGPRIKVTVKSSDGSSFAVGVS